MTVVIKNTSGLPLERWIFDLGYLTIAEGREREAGCVLVYGNGLMIVW